jgi:hypothetical protein
MHVSLHFKNCAVYVAYARRPRIALDPATPRYPVTKIPYTIEWLGQLDHRLKALQQLLVEILHMHIVNIHGL